MYDRGLIAQSESGVFRMLEFDETESEVHIVRRILEFDADSMAALIQVEGLLSQPLYEHAKIAFGPYAEVDMEWDHVAYLWLISVGVLFQLFAVLDKSPIKEPTRTHPHPDLRFFVLANFAWSSWSKVIANAETYSAVVNRAREDLWGIWEALDLPSTEARKSSNYDTDFWDAHKVFQKGFNEVANPLNELSTQRINKGNST